MSLLESSGGSADPANLLRVTFRETSNEILFPSGTIGSPSFVKCFPFPHSSPTLQARGLFELLNGVSRRSNGTLSPKIRPNVLVVTAPLLPTSVPELIRANVSPFLKSAFFYACFMLVSLPPPSSVEYWHLPPPSSLCPLSPSSLSNARFPPLNARPRVHQPPFAFPPVLFPTASSFSPCLSAKCLWIVFCVPPPSESPFSFFASSDPQQKNSSCFFFHPV